MVSIKRELFIKKKRNPQQLLPYFFNLYRPEQKSFTYLLRIVHIFVLTFLIPYLVHGVSKKPVRSAGPTSSQKLHTCQKERKIAMEI